MEGIDRMVELAVSLIDHDDFSSANLMVSNFYHRSTRSLDEYLTMLKVTKNHDRFITSSEQTQQLISRILYTLDKRYNSIRNPIFVKKTDDTYSIQEASTPAA